MASALQAADVPYMLTGSLASSLYGLPRATNDIDIVIAPGRQQLFLLVEILEKADLYVSREEVTTALETRGQFNVIDFSSGWKVDMIVCKNREFSMTEFQRRRESEVAGVPLVVASPEDVIIAKLEWARLGQSEQQLRDVAGILQMNTGALDLAYIERWITALGLHEQWAAARRSGA
jgi:hypothetical protein